MYTILHSAICIENSIQRMSLMSLYSTLQCCNIRLTHEMIRSRDALLSHTLLTDAVSLWSSLSLLPICLWKMADRGSFAVTIGSARVIISQDPNLTSHPPTSHRLNRHRYLSAQCHGSEKRGRGGGRGSQRGEKKGNGRFWSVRMDVHLDYAYVRSWP